MNNFKDKKEQREWEENIASDVSDFMKEIAGVKKHEFPVGDTKEWRKKRNKKKKDPRYNETDNKDSD